MSWVLSHPEITTDVTLTHALSFLGFIAGGLGYVVGLGFLVAGLSELSFLSVPIAPLQILLPVGRFDGLPWLVAVGFLLPQNRPPRIDRKDDQFRTPRREGRTVHRRAM
ncbi:hypothetical protein [Paenarthrobacter sp. PH39-S1]|uniref:hypothetical protein n=1 Tax=Paenarthrobacter sp. PH39-S1 TaxID=3046204 RepID=UPI0024B91F1E|nr:hypothetical protein [Paenarthrobacter sp. PH39-S1]